MMGMLPPVSQRAYTTQNQKLFVASSNVREVSFADDAAELRKDVPEDQVLDITVTCDGTLARRGFQSLYGIVVVVSWKSGKVLDVEVLSKHCQACATHHEMNTSSDEILDWWEGHQASCEVNYCGSSPAMESTGALVIWKRSVSKNMLRYTQIISDGDSKTFKLLSDQLPYGVSNLVSKHECVEHMQKRMGTAMQDAAWEDFYHSQSSVPVLPQWPAVLVQVQLGTCQFRAISTPLTHHRSRHCSSSQKGL